MYYLYIIDYYRGLQFLNLNDIYQPNFDVQNLDLPSKELIV